MSEPNTEYVRDFRSGQRVMNTHLDGGTITKDQRAYSEYDLVIVQMDGYSVPKSYQAGHLTDWASD